MLFYKQAKTQRYPVWLKPFLFTGHLQLFSIALRSWSTFLLPCFLAHRLLTSLAMYMKLSLPLKWSHLRSWKQQVVRYKHLSERTGLCHCNPASLMAMYEINWVNAEDLWSIKHSSCIKSWVVHQFPRLLWRCVPGFSHCWRQRGQSVWTQLCIIMRHRQVLSSAGCLSQLKFGKGPDLRMFSLNHRVDLAVGKLTWDPSDGDI